MSNSNVLKKMSWAVGEALMGASGSSTGPSMKKGKSMQDIDQTNRGKDSAVVEEKYTYVGEN